MTTETETPLAASYLAAALRDRADLRTRYHEGGDAFDVDVSGVTFTVAVYRASPNTAPVEASPEAAIECAGASAGSTIRTEVPHVWDIDGEPVGVAHEMTLSADGALTVRDVRVDSDGERHGVMATLPFTRAVHVLLNLTDEELIAAETRIARDEAIRAEPLIGTRERASRG